MPREAMVATPARRLLRLLGAAATLLRLELKILTGNRALVLAAIEAAWLAVIVLMARLRDSPWDVESFYVRSVVLPALLPAIALGMVAVMGDRDSRQLEVSFVSAGGRHALWSFRFAAILLVCFLTAATLSAGTWLLIDRDFEPVLAAVHAAVPISFVAALTFCASVAFRSEAIAGLVAVAAILGSRFLTAVTRKVDLFLNPLVPPESMLVQADWARLLFWNRTLYVLAAVLLFAAALHLLQRRERLL